MMKKITILHSIHDGNKIFQLIYDEMGYPDYTKTYKRLTDDLYIRGMTKKLPEFTKQCPQYQVN